MKIPERSKKLLNSILDILLPPACLACQKILDKQDVSEQVCKKCKDKIKLHTHPFFIPPNITLFACASYENPTVQNLIHTLKYKQIESAITPITELIIEPYLESIKNWKLEKIGNFTIAPIPLHKSKLRKRGFNQSLLIANALAKSLRPVIPAEAEIHIKNLLTRTRKTESQTELKNTNEKIKNLKSAFEITTTTTCYKCYDRSICNKSAKPKTLNQLILIDDVATSGSTLKEATKTLNKAGIKNITAFTLAKA